jgi:phage head maturation protease
LDIEALERLDHFLVGVVSVGIEVGVKVDPVGVADQVALNETTFVGVEVLVAVGVAVLVGVSVGVGVGVEVRVGVLV